MNRRTFMYPSEISLMVKWISEDIKRHNPDFEDMDLIYKFDQFDKWFELNAGFHARTFKILKKDLIAHRFKIRREWAERYLDIEQDA